MLGFPSLRTFCPIVALTLAACSSSPDGSPADAGPAAEPGTGGAPEGSPASGGSGAGGAATGGVTGGSGGGATGGSAGSTGGAHPTGPDAGAEGTGGARIDGGPSGGGSPDGAAARDSGPAPAGTALLVGVGNWGLRGRSETGQVWDYCGNPSTGNDHSPDLLRNVAYGDGVFLAVGGDANGQVMRSLDGIHWEEDVHPTDACPGDRFPSSCTNWIGAVVYGAGTWLAGGGNGALMRSRDGGLGWTSLHPDPGPNAVRSLAFGSGRFAAGTDGGFVAVSPDAGDTWMLHELWQYSMNIAYGGGAFIAWGAHWNGSGFDRACFASTNAGDDFIPCSSTVAQATSFVHDGTRWVAALPDAYATSDDATAWTSHAANGFPSTLLFHESTWFGRRGASVLVGSDPDSLSEVATGVEDFRAWTVGRVLDRNLPVMGVPACVDAR